MHYGVTGRIRHEMAPGELDCPNIGNMKLNHATTPSPGAPLKVGSLWRGLVLKALLKAAESHANPPNPAWVHANTSDLHKPTI